MKRLLALLLLGLSCHGFAQLNLLVNGLSVPGVTTSLVSNIAYAPAEALVAAIGGHLRVDRALGRVTLTLGAAIVQGELVEGAAAAAASSGAWSRDGSARPGTAALLQQEALYLPVKAVGEAFGGRVSFLGETQSVVLVLPRPTLNISAEGAGNEERLRFALSAPTAVSSSFDASSGVLEVLFDRTDVPLRTPVALAGDGFRAVEVLPGRGSTLLRIRLPSDRVPRVVAVPDGAGMQWLVGSSDPAEALAWVAGHWVLDAAHGLERDDAGELTRVFVDQMVAVLAGSALTLERTRPSLAPLALAERSAMGIGADGFVSVYPADLLAGNLRIYVLGDAEGIETLTAAMRLNAASALPEATTDRLRRALLLRLIPDLVRGERWAAALAQTLERNGWMVEGPLVAPLAVLAGAAGRGLVLELALTDLQREGVADELARALLASWPEVP